MSFFFFPNIFLHGIREQGSDSRTMASNTQNSDQSSGAIITSQPDSFPQPVTNHKLNGQNYLAWSQSVLMFIRGKGKDEYITGEAKAPAEDSQTFKVWKTNNIMVQSWLINSMTPEIGENFLLFATAAEIWEAAKLTYSIIDNTSELFETESVLHELRQGESTVTHYFSTLTRLWQKIDLYDQQHWKCPDDVTLYKHLVETKRVFKFLSGLNKDLDEVR